MSVSNRKDVAVVAYIWDNDPARFDLQEKDQGSIIVHNRPDSSVDGRISVRIVLTQLSQDTIMVSGVAASANWFHNVQLQSRAFCFLIEGAHLTASGEHELSIRASHF